MTTALLPLLIDPIARAERLDEMADGIASGAIECIDITPAMRAQLARFAVGQSSLDA